MITHAKKKVSPRDLAGNTEEEEDKEEEEEEEQWLILRYTVLVLNVQLGAFSVLL